MCTYIPWQDIYNWSSLACSSPRDEMSADGPPSLEYQLERTMCTLLGKEK